MGFPLVTVIFFANDCQGKTLSTKSNYRWCSCVKISWWFIHCICQHLPVDSLVLCDGLVGTDKTSGLWNVKSTWKTSKHVTWLRHVPNVRWLIFYLHLRARYNSLYVCVFVSYAPVKTNPSVVLQHKKWHKSMFN